MVTVNLRSKLRVSATLNLGSTPSITLRLDLHTASISGTQQRRQSAKSGNVCHLLRQATYLNNIIRKVRGLIKRCFVNELNFSTARNISE